MPAHPSAIPAAIAHSAARPLPDFDRDSVDTGIARPPFPPGGGEAALLFLQEVIAVASPRPPPWAADR